MALPNLRQALRNFGRPLQFAIIEKSVVDFEAVETTLDVKYLNGVMTPMTAQKLLIKPEGQRQWKWWEIITTTRLNLDWLLQDPAGKRYRIMSITDWSQAGFYTYELTEAPQ